MKNLKKYLKGKKYSIVTIDLYFDTKNAQKKLNDELRIKFLAGETLSLGDFGTVKIYKITEDLKSYRLSVSLVDKDKKVMTSPDGKNWSLKKNNIKQTEKWRDITYNNNSKLFEMEVE